MNIDTTTEAGQIANLALAASGLPEVITNGAGREFLILPEDHAYHDVTERNAVDKLLPDHIGQDVKLQTVDSLVDYVNRYKTEHTVLFADIGSNTIVGAIDYHGASGDKPGTADHVDHRATLTLPLSVEWMTWTAAHDRKVSQLDFARFLEENASDIMQPAAADLLDSVRDLQGARKVQFKRAIRTATNTESFEYTDESTATSGGVELATLMTLNVPIYFDGEFVQPKAFLRWDLDDGRLLLGIALHRAEHVRQATFKRIVLDASARTGRPAVFGKIG
jgi:uncharacterized protein YfdQ (DUF2303 family)